IEFLHPTRSIPDETVGRSYSEDDFPRGFRKMSKLLATAVALTGVVAVFAVGTGGAANEHAAAAAVCPAAVVGFAHCHALVTVDARGNPSASTSPTGLSPATIKSVYGFATSG